MWSVWSECVDIYLGQGIAMLKVKHKEVQVVHYPATLPLDRVVDRLTQALVSHSKFHKILRPRLRITLSGALCPAMSFKFPQDVVRWHELRQIACASAAASLGCSSEQIECETDAARPGIAAPVAVHLMAELQRWAMAQNCHIESLCPLWAMATQSQEVCQPAVQGMLMQEPDSMTLVGDDGSGKIIAATLVGEHGLAVGNINVRRWLIGLGLTENKLLKLSFSTQRHIDMPKSSKGWAAHWSVV